VVRSNSRSSQYSLCSFAFYSAA